MAGRCCAVLSRRRLDLENITADTTLSRCLGLLDLTALGVGTTLGLGAYVLAAEIGKNTAGPAVCISFLIAAVASALTGLCYAEFASRIPKAGSAYVYSYVTTGELVAFLIGWNLILEYVLGIASVARGFSNYFDFLTGNVMSKALRQAMPMNVSFLSEYPDFFAFGVVISIAILLAVGVKKSTLLNNVFTAVNLMTILIIIVAGSINADAGNWSIAEEDIPEGTENAGTGGFLPFGFKGVLNGAATCFFAFVGFDAIMTTGEEAKKPQRNIPWAIGISLTIIFFAYFGISTVVTLMWPYYDQNTEAPFPHIFEQIGLPAVQWIVNIGVLFALCTSMIGAMFPLARIFYAMANDGMLFKFLGKVNPRTQTPLVGTIVSGLVSGVMVLIFKVNHLIHMMSIGTLLAYGTVVLGVLRLRYQPELHNISISYAEEPRLTFWIGMKQIFNLNGVSQPTKFSGRVANVGITLYSILVPILISVFNANESKVMNGDIGIIIALAMVGLIMVLIVIALGRQPVLDTKSAFKVPFVPVLPCTSCLLNTYLMLQLDATAWIVFGGWMGIGLVIYFAYGIRNSVHKTKHKVEEHSDLVQQNPKNGEKFGEAGISRTALKLDEMHYSHDGEFVKVLQAHAYPEDHKSGIV